MKSLLSILAILAIAAAAASGGPPDEDQLVRINARPPELVGGPWINTTKGEPIKLADRKGKVTIVHFWTFG